MESGIFYNGIKNMFAMVPWIPCPLNKEYVVDGIGYNLQEEAETCSQIQPWKFCQ